MKKKRPKGLKYNIITVNKGWFKDKSRKKTAKCLICNNSFEFYPLTRKRKYCSLNCYRISQKGKKRPEHSKKMSGRTYKGRPLTAEHRKKLSGSNSPMWKGGITTIQHKIRRLPEYDRWRFLIYKRDLFTCQECKKVGIRLECHHIKSFAQIIKDNHIKTIKKALECKELWNINNGITYCKKCHKLTDSYGKNIY